MRRALPQEGSRRRPQREVVEILEPKLEDKRLDQLLLVRKQRLNRLERECNEARKLWRERRLQLRELKQNWRDALREAKAQWQASSTEFLTMTITSGQFRRAKAAYTRMQQEAAELYLQCQEQLSHCTRAGGAFFEARRCVMQANRQNEKLHILRDEIKLASQQSEI